MKHIVARNTSQTPIYQQIYEQLSSQIMNGDLKADQLLPSIRTAAKELYVSYQTILDICHGRIKREAIVNVRFKKEE